MNVCDVNELRALMGRHGFRISKSKSQNFVVQDWVPREIVDSSGADENTGVLEIGPGVGALTRELSVRAGKVAAVEVDSSLLPVLKETLSECQNVNVICDDILKMDLNVLLDQEFQGLSPMVCANLPYNITSPVLSRLLESRLFPTITVMIQKEVAQRICAAPGDRDCSAFSLYCQYFAQCTMLFDVSPDCFYPVPKVTSTVIQLCQWENPPVEVEDEALLFRTIRGGFALRRKTLVNSMGTVFPSISKYEMTRIVEECGFSPTIRGEKLSLEDYAILSAKLGEREKGK